MHDPQGHFQQRDDAEAAIQEAISCLTAAYDTLQASGDSDVRPALIEAGSSLDEAANHIADAQSAAKVTKSLADMSPADHLKQLGQPDGPGRYHDHVAKTRRRPMGGGPK